MRPYSAEELRPEFEAYLAWVQELGQAPFASAGMPVSRWYRANGLELYTRHGRAVVVQGVQHALCLANIELSERRQGRGYFSHLVAYLVDHAPSLGYRALKVESVNNPRLLDWLLRQGFAPVAGTDLLFGSSVAIEFADHNTNLK